MIIHHGVTDTRNFRRSEPQKISLIISFLSHIVLLLAFQKLIPLDWNEDIFRTYRVDITSNSWYEILDREAVKSIRTAAPFPPFPAHITAKRLNIRAGFYYRLTARR